MSKSKWDIIKNKLILVTAWARDGLIDEQIAKNLGIGLTTFKDYKNKYPSFMTALKKGKEVTDIQVENSLNKRANGYSYTEITKEMVFDPLTKTSSLEVTKEVIKEVQPDVTAQIFWLKNRKPKEWRDKQELEHSGDLNHDIQINFNIPRPKSD